MAHTSSSIKAITLTASDLQRMLADAPDTSPEHLATMKREVQMRREQEQAAARARKEKMLRLQEEAKKAVGDWIVPPGAPRGGGVWWWRW
jgi:hypothetical protein